jgi:hypothetical protein
VGLLDLGNVTRRRHGGAGFTLAGPCLEITGEGRPRWCWEWIGITIAPDERWSSPWRRSSGPAGRSVLDQRNGSGTIGQTHVSRAMVKLGAPDRSKFVVFACDAGLVCPGWTTSLSARSCFSQACSRT